MGLDSKLVSRVLSVHSSSLSMYSEKFPVNCSCTCQEKQPGFHSPVSLHWIKLSHCRFFRQPNGKRPKGSLLMQGSDLISRSSTVKRGEGLTFQLVQLQPRSPSLSQSNMATTLSPELPPRLWERGWYN